MKEIAIIGAGSFSMALAHLLSNKGHKITIWSHSTDIAEYINKNHKNPVFLKDVKLPSNKVKAVTSLSEVLDKPFLLIAIPTQFIRDTLSKVNINSKTIIINCAKGIETNSLKTISEVLEEIFPFEYHNNFAFISGPSFALELAKKQLTAVSVASKSQKVSTIVQKLFSTKYLRVYTSHDIIGIEVCGSLKNVIAIASGIVDGLGLGHNTRAALITRGLAEITRLGIKKGANPLTFLGLAGIGDLVLTCTGDLSRNRHVGVELASGKSLSQILSEMTMIAEGVKTTESAYELSKQLKVEMPIIEQMYQILYHNKSPKKAVEELMTRHLKPEIDFIN